VKTLALQEKDVLIIGPDLFSIVAGGGSKRFALSGMSSCELEKLGLFEFIFWSDLSEEVSLTKAQKMVKKEEALIDSIEQELPDLRSIKYSDEDLEAFCNIVAKQSPMEIANFLKELLEQGQISEKQYDHIVDRYQLSKQKTKQSIPLNLATKELDIYPFLMSCLEKHLHKGGSLIGMLTAYPSLYENVAFFETVITNPQYEFKESVTEFQGRKGIFFTVLRTAQKG